MRCHHNLKFNKGCSLTCHLAGILKRAIITLSSSLIYEFKIAQSCSFWIQWYKKKRFNVAIFQLNFLFHTLISRDLRILKRGTFSQTFDQIKHDNSSIQFPCIIDNDQCRKFVIHYHLWGELSCLLRMIDPRIFLPNFSHF